MKKLYVEVKIEADQSMEVRVDSVTR